MIQFESSWGMLVTQDNGEVFEVEGDEVINGEENYLHKIAKVNIVELAEWLKSLGHSITEYTEGDILEVGFWYKDGTYSEPDSSWRSGGE